MFKQTIRTNILIIFALLISTISLSLLISQYYFNEELAVNSTDKTFKLISSNISTQLRKEAEQIHTALEVNKNNKNLYLPITFDYKHPGILNMIELMMLNNKIYAINFTHKDGSFFEVVNMKESKKLFNLYKAPIKTRWSVIISINNINQYTFLDKNHQFISQYSIAKKYNPLKRPWYKSAINSNNTISTEPYLFANIDKIGTTYSIQLDQKGSVFSIDLTMQTINSLLALQKSEEDSEVFLFNKNGDKVASSRDNLRRVPPTLMKLFNNHEKNKTLNYFQQGKNYYVKYQQLMNNNLYLGIKISSDNLKKPYNDNIRYSLSIALLLLLLSTPIVLFAINVIVKPIKTLIIENEKIKNREFERVKKIDTNIIEFMELSDSFVSMSQSIKEYQDAQEKLLDSIVKLIAEAIDAKSAYTGGHCKRVPEIAKMLVNEANQSHKGIFKNFSLSTEDELREFELGAWLHDCGKVTTPEYVVDKSTKLESINNRIHEIRTRFEVLWRDAQIEYLYAKLDSQNEVKSLERLHSKQTKLIDDFSFLASANIGGEFMDKAKQDRVKKIASLEWQRNFDDSLGLSEVEMLRYDKESAQTLPATERLLSDKTQHIIKREKFDYKAYQRDGFKEDVPKYLYNYGEIYNLCISKGTLSSEERYKINEHVIMSIKMLEKVPFPANMTKIPEYAGTHHETLIGTGYPRKLTKKDLSIPERIIAVADIFEALTASDRPYKKTKSLSTSIKIMSSMVKDQHIDEDIFKLFLSSGIYKSYAHKYLKVEQIDEVDIEKYL